MILFCFEDRSNHKKKQRILISSGNNVELGIGRYNHINQHLSKEIVLVKLGYFGKIIIQLSREIAFE